MPPRVGCHAFADIPSRLSEMPTPPLDREFVVTEDHVRRASHAAFVAWHRTPRQWIKYVAYVIAGVALAWLFDDPKFAVLIPLVIGAEAVTFYRRGVRDTREQEPVGTSIALGFGAESFSFKTWIRSGEVPYSAVTKVVKSSGCTVIVALSEHIFWPLPAEVVPPQALVQMRANRR